MKRLVQAVDTKGARESVCQAKKESPQRL